jgi:DNA (cytosine-5)-methyltransferase 1
MSNPIKVIDLFAGPGGLGEGFASVGPDSAPTFKIVVSVEKEVCAHKTLTLRAFTREFKNRILPKEYYQYVKGEITKVELTDKYPLQWAAANAETLGRPTELGIDNELIHNSIDRALGKTKDPWVLIGGPPCQAYSLVGRARNTNKKDYIAEADGRHYLYKEYLNIIKEFGPSVFVMENVKGILSSTPSGAPIFETILNDLKGSNHDNFQYKIYSLSMPPRSYDNGNPNFSSKDFIVKAEQYGVPQARHRVILVGIRSDLKVAPEEVLLKSKDQVVLESVLNRMPRLRSGLSKNDSEKQWMELAQGGLNESRDNIKDLLSIYPKIDLPSSRGSLFVPLADYPLSQDIPTDLYQWFYDSKLGGLLDHDTRGHMDSDIARYAFVSSFGEQMGRSPRLNDFPDHLLPNHKNVKSNKFVDRFKVQLKNRPATTITCHISKDGHYFIHYDSSQCRSLTVREAARAQTFPDNYFFEGGGRTDKYVQVGNAVPPYLARLIAVNLAAILSD